MPCFMQDALPSEAALADISALLKHSQLTRGAEGADVSLKNNAPLDSDATEGHMHVRPPQRRDIPPYVPLETAEHPRTEGCGASLYLSASDFRLLQVPATTSLPKEHGNATSAAESTIRSGTVLPGSRAAQGSDVSEHACPPSVDHSHASSSLSLYAAAKRKALMPLNTALLLDADVSRDADCASKSPAVALSEGACDAATAAESTAGSGAVHAHTRLPRTRLVSSLSDANVARDAITQGMCLSKTFVRATGAGAGAPCRASQPTTLPNGMDFATLQEVVPGPHSTQRSLWPTTRSGGRYEGLRSIASPMHAVAADGPVATGDVSHAYGPDPQPNVVHPACAEYAAAATGTSFCAGSRHESQRAAGIAVQGYDPPVSAPVHDSCMRAPIIHEAHALVAAVAAMEQGERSGGGQECSVGHRNTCDDPNLPLMRDATAAHSTMHALQSEPSKDTSVGLRRNEQDGMHETYTQAAHVHAYAPDDHKALAQHEGWPKSSLPLHFHRACSAQEASTRVEFEGASERELGWHPEPPLGAAKATRVPVGDRYGCCASVTRGTGRTTSLLGESGDAVGVAQAALARVADAHRSDELMHYEFWGPFWELTEVRTYSCLDTSLYPIESHRNGSIRLFLSADWMLLEASEEDATYAGAARAADGVVI